MSLDNQRRQWEAAVLGLPAYALGAVAVAAIAIFAAPRLPRAERLLRWIALAMLAFAGVLFVMWARDTGEWKTAIDYRGPSLVMSLLVMGLAFLDATAWLPRPERLPDAARARTLLTHAASLVFCVTIVVQCVTWRGELDSLRSAMAASETPCVPRSTVAGIDDNPADFWSLPATSLMLQDVQPEHVILPDHLCESAAATGTFPLALYEPNVAATSNHIDLLPLSWTMASNSCWMTLTSGWHAHEQAGETWWRWTPGDGEIRILVGGEATAMTTGKITSLPRPNRVSVVVNGETQQVIELTNDEWKPMDGLSLDLRAGENIVRFVSEQPAGQAPPDQRDLAVAIMNLNLTVPSLRTQCTLR